ncbi:hypothetical protein L596_008144 [Steinernema carpocapsae]|uniref:PDZ domain-containing protein n=1 Tax=Steinernema carpocapsae TaxID=34508 RepID=A0A4U5PBU5_STECR|nr:hypothetical protein L596_008144 [Steinernema carpocapsae]
MGNKRREERSNAAPDSDAHSTRRARRRRNPPSSDQLSDDTRTARSTSAETCEAKNNVDAIEGIEQPTRTVEAEILYDEDENIGLKLNPNMVVEAVSPNSAAEGKILTGDVIVSINNTPVENVDHYFQLVRRLFPQIAVVVSRPVFRTSAPASRLKKAGLTSLVEGTFQGDDFFIAHIIFRPGMRLGLSLRSHRDRVVVSKVSGEGIGANRFEMGDIIWDVNGTLVKNKLQTKNLMMFALEHVGYCSVLTQRPSNAQSVQLSKMVLGQPTADAIDPPMCSDATLIGKKQMRRHREQETPRRPESYAANPAKPLTRPK